MTLKVPLSRPFLSVILRAEVFPLHITINNKGFAFTTTPRSGRRGKQMGGPPWETPTSSSESSDEGTKPCRVGEQLRTVNRLYLSRQNSTVLYSKNIFHHSIRQLSFKKKRYTHSHRIEHSGIMVWNQWRSLWFKHSNCIWSAYYTSTEAPAQIKGS